MLFIIIFNHSVLKIMQVDNPSNDKTSELQLCSQLREVSISKFEGELYASYLEDAAVVREPWFYSQLSSKGVNIERVNEDAVDQVASSIIHVVFEDIPRCSSSSIEIIKNGEVVAIFSRYCLDTAVEIVEDPELLMDVEYEGIFSREIDGDKSNYLFIWSDFMENVQPKPYIAKVKRRYRKISPQCTEIISVSGSEPRQCKNRTRDLTCKCWRHRLQIFKSEK